VSRRAARLAAALGPLVTLAGALTYFTWLVRFPTLRDVPWVNLPVVAAGVALSAAGMVAALRAAGRGARILAVAGFAFSGGLAALFAVYVFGLSYGLPAPTERALTLAGAPRFTLPDHEGRPVSLAALRGRKLVITFYRGHW
jgi:hypothetical protein